ncbi:MAG TPA: zf-HC2 domain-containing protein [Amycolatopsis sp.]|nr:zf-HC2 domain-containing protein [Amycolatopsis sp.]
MSRPDDTFSTFDAAYVLGALSPEDRGAFEHHLKECDACARAVQDLAGLPGLLSHVTPEMVDVDSPPAELLPTALTRARRARRRRTFTTLGTATAAIAAAVAVVIAVLVPSGGTVPGTAMTPLGSYPVQAVAAVAPLSGGSRVDMSCSYEGSSGNADYQLVAVRRDGTEARLASWWADPGRTAKMSIDTALLPGEIQALEIRTTDGMTVLRWSP